jgi:FTR1 family protein
MAYQDKQGPGEQRYEPPCEGQDEALDGEICHVHLAIRDCPKRGHRGSVVSPVPVTLCRKESTDEDVRFIAGVGLGLPATSFPLAVLCGLGAGALVGYLIYKGGNKTSLQIFLVISTCFLYLVAAGLFSKGVWNLEQDAWVKLAGEGAAEAGAGPGSYDIRKSVWHVNVSLV